MAFSVASLRDFGRIGMIGWVSVPGDLRRAFRSLARRRTFAVSAVLTLALAFSIPAVVLSTLDRHFWRPLDLPESDRLFTVQIRDEDGYFGQPRSSEHLPLLREMGAEAFSLAAFESLNFTMVAGGAPTRVDVALVTGDFFMVLGATPAHGRLLAPGDDDPGGSPAVAVVSHRAWTTHFGRDASIVGRTVRLGPQAFTVVGVAANPLPGPTHDPDFWVSLTAVPGMLGPGRVSGCTRSGGWARRRRSPMSRRWLRWPGTGYRPNRSTGASSPGPSITSGSVPTITARPPAS